MATEPTKHVNGRMWPPGVSGNPNGRPLGSRTVFSQGFLKDLAGVWASHGKETIIKTAQDNPGVFFATCARLIGPEVKLTIEQTSSRQSKQGGPQFSSRIIPIIDKE